MASEYDNRAIVSFEQAEGVAEMPRQLARTEITKELRSYIWYVIHTSLESCTGRHYSNSGEIIGSWKKILFAKHIFKDHGMVDEFSIKASKHSATLKNVIVNGNYTDVYGLLQWIIRQPEAPKGFAIGIEAALKRGNSAYRLVGGDTLIPIGSDDEATAIKGTLEDVKGAQFPGAGAHLRASSDALSEGRWSDSIRESISAVESVAKLWAKEGNTLGPALKALAKSDHIHGSLQEGFAKLYGYTNDKEGIRHALLDKATAEVDEGDALYMYGACAAFVSYMIRKAHKIGLTQGQHSLSLEFKS